MYVCVLHLFDFCCRSQASIRTLRSQLSERLVSLWRSALVFTGLPAHALAPPSSSPSASTASDATAAASGAFPPVSVLPAADALGLAAAEGAAARLADAFDGLERLGLVGQAVNEWVRPLLALLSALLTLRSNAKRL